MLTGCGNNDVKTYYKEQMNKVVEYDIDEVMENNDSLAENTTENNNSIANNNTESNKDTASNDNTTKSKVVSVQLQEEVLYDSVYGIFHAYDANGNEIWKYTTKNCPATELVTIEDLGSYDEEKYLYINEGGTIIKFDKQTGKIIWKNSDFQGASSVYTFGKDGTLYISGYYGPDLCVISKEGKTIKNIELGEGDVDKYFWPFEMWLNGDKLVIRFDGTPEGEGYVTKFEINTKDYSYNTTYEPV